MAETTTRCGLCGGPAPTGCRCRDALDAFVAQLENELRENAHKGGRGGPGGWVAGMTPDKRINELLYHVAKLSYAQRQYLQGDGDAEQVREFAADVGNCALMVADGLGLLIPELEVADAA